MGNSHDPQQDEKDTHELTTLSVLMPAYKRYLSHHAMNSISNILASSHLAQLALADGRMEEVKNHLARIDVATNHLTDDLRKAGI